MEPLINYFKDIEIETILDVGTGKGAFIHDLERIFPGAAITAIDPSIDSIDVARGYFPKVTFFAMGAEDIRFADETFDVVTMSKALHHLQKIKKGLKEIRRTVKPDGFIIIKEPVSDGLTPAQEVNKMYHHFRSAIDRLTGEYHRNTFTRKAILQMLKDAGLPVQFYFEQVRYSNLAEDEANMELRIDKMKQMLKKIEGHPDYEKFRVQIDDFSQKAVTYGMQPVTNLVIVARKK